MLSDSLEALSAHFNEWARKGGVEVAVPACRAIADELRALAQDARALEAAQVPAGCRVTRADYGPDVIVVDFIQLSAQRALARAAAHGGAA